MGLKNLENAFWESIEKETKGLSSAAVLFSGGLDSSVIAKGISCKIKHTVLFCAGLQGSQDLIVARKSAERMNLPIVERIVETEEIPQALSIVKKILAGKKLSQPLNLQIGVSEYFAFQAAKQAGFETVFMGQGADELFAGYDAFRKIVKEKGLNAVNAECKKFLQKAERIDLKRDKAIAKHFGLELRLPFTEKDFVKVALEIPAREKIHSEKDLLRKHALRKLAGRIGVPKISRERPKKAMQYGSGIGKSLRKLIKEDIQAPSSFPASPKSGKAH